jgi:SOS response regulatory protein OraA/RecX
MSDEALECALRALRHRDRTEREVGELLRSRGFSEDESTDAIDRLVRTGVVSDERFAEARAISLAARGEGDALIRRRLVAAGVASDLVAASLEAVEPELERARRIVVRRGASTKTARYLFGKGFSDEIVKVAVADGVDGGLG